jgi:hypothetical protein
LSNVHRLVNTFRRQAFKSGLVEGALRFVLQPMLFYIGFDSLDFTFVQRRLV